MRELIAKMVILGDQGVGKTSVALRQYSDTYNTTVSATLGAANYTCSVPLGEIHVKLRIWDTAGQERFKAILPLYYRGASAALLMYDITQPETFDNVKRWVHELNGQVIDTMVLCLVGNKLDLCAERLVDRHEAQQYANSIGAKYFECSAKENVGIEQVFHSIARDVARLKSTVFHSLSNNECEPLEATSTDENPTDVGVVEEPRLSGGAIALATVENQHKCC